jgi:hypothetical protein
MSGAGTILLTPGYLLFVIYLSILLTDPFGTFGIHQTISKPSA